MLNRYLDVFASLDSQGVRYVVIGGIAAVVHGVPRATFDLNLLIDASMDNAKKLLQAFEKANLGTALLTTADDLLHQEITIFQDRVRIDVQTSTPGVRFAEAWEHRKTFIFQRVRIEIYRTRGSDCDKTLHWSRC